MSNGSPRRRRRLAASNAAVPAAISVATLLTAATVGLLPSVSMSTSLLANTVLIMGGNDNPNGDNMEQLLDNYFDENDPNYGFPGYELVKVPWLADSFDGNPGYEPSQSDGVTKLDSAISQYLNSSDDSVVVVGYSSSANVVVREMRDLDSRGDAAPSPGQISFVVIASPHRPNGGIFTRFPGLNLFGINFEGPNPDTQYQLTDIGYEYDPISDFPTYPLMPLTLLNAALAFEFEHVYYAGPNADLDNALTNPNLTYYDEATGINYVTIAAPHLPLLAPAYLVFDITGTTPLVQPAFDLVEPTLKALVDLGYDRTIPVGQNTPAQLFPGLEPVAVTNDLTNSIGEGVAESTGNIPEPFAGPDNTTDRLADQSDDNPEIEPADDSGAAELGSNDDDGTDSTVPAENITPPRQPSLVAVPRNLQQGLQLIRHNLGLDVNDTATDDNDPTAISNTPSESPSDDDDSSSSSDAAAS